MTEKQKFKALKEALIGLVACFDYGEELAKKNDFSDNSCLQYLSNLEVYTRRARKALMQYLNIEIH